MIRLHRRAASAVPTVPPQAHTVRLLYGEEELQAAVERARAFERRGSDEYQRRLGTYDRLLTGALGYPTNVVTMDPPIMAPAVERDRARTDGDNAHEGPSAVQA